VTNDSEKVVEENKAHTWSSVTILPKIAPFVRLCGRVWRNGTVQRWQYNTAQIEAIEVSDNSGRTTDSTTKTEYLLLLTTAGSIIVARQEARGAFTWQNLTIMYWW